LRLNLCVPAYRTAGVKQALSALLPLTDSGAAIIQGEHMLYTIAVVLAILWLLGLVTSYTMGGLIHVLLVIAIIVVLLRVINGRSPL